MLEAILIDVSKVRHDLEVLVSLRDPLLGTPLIDAARMENCTKAVNSLEDTLSDILTLPWIPKSLSRLYVSIAAMLQNAKDVEQMVNGATDVRKGLPEEMVGLKVVEISSRILRFQLDTLFQAVGKLMAATEKITVGESN